MNNLESMDMQDALSPMQAALNIVDDLPFPEYLPTGGYRVIHRNIEHMGAHELLLLIKEYNLKLTARNKRSYREVLKEFSKNSREWDLKEPPTVRHHKGPHKKRQCDPDDPSRAEETETPRVKRIKVSTARREQLMPDRVSGSMRDTRTVPKRSPAQQEELLTWACDVVENSKAGGVDTALSRSTNEVTNAATSSPVTAQLNAIEAMLQQIVSRPHPDSNSSPSESVNASESLDSSHVTPESTATSDSEPTGSTGREMLKLANKIVLFSKGDIPDPPNMSFSQDIVQLDRIWDDLSPQWCNYSPLVICGNYIPMKYWSIVYKYRLPKQWSGIKQLWHQYKAFVTEYRLLQPDDFWRKYSSPLGQRLSFSEISRKINQDNRERDLQTSNAAKIEYKESFADYFTYRRGGQTLVMTDPHAIARRSLALKASASIN